MAFLDELKKLTHPYAEDDDLFREEEETYKTTREKQKAASFDSDFDMPAAPTAERRRGNSKVVNISAATQLQVVLARPDRFEQAAELADHLREKRAVVVNMEAADKDLTRRVVDFLSGCAYALDGRVKKVAVSTFLATPYNVDIVGDIIDELENSGLYL